MIDALWVTLTVSCLIGVWVLVALVSWLGRTASDLSGFLKHEALLQHRRRQDFPAPGRRGQEGPP